MEFEKSLAKLEEIVEKLEKGDVDLDESIELFEKGMNLLNDLKEYLGKAESKIQKLIRDSEGNLKADEYKELSERLEEEG